MSKKITTFSEAFADEQPKKQRRTKQKKEPAPKPKQEQTHELLTLDECDKRTKKPCMICNSLCEANELDVYVYCKDGATCNLAFNHLWFWGDPPKMYSPWWNVDRTGPCIICSKETKTFDMNPYLFCRTVECVTAYKKLMDLDNPKPVVFHPRFYDHHRFKDWDLNRFNRGRRPDIIKGINPRLENDEKFRPHARPF